jgi:ElaB/YqjD/DUF883 family membrane-anchored ribosome-binding protein
MSSATATAKEAVHQKKQANGVRDAEIHPFQQAREELDTAMHNAGRQVRDFIDDAGENLMNAKESVVDVTENVVKQVKRKPLPSVLIAAGVGMLLGGIFFRRS